MLNRRPCISETMIGRQISVLVVKRLRGKYSSWKEVTSSVPQGSALAPIMILVYINDINNNIETESYMNVCRPYKNTEKNHNGNFMF